MLSGYYIFTPSTDMFFVMDNKRTTEKTLKEISDAINKHLDITTTPETIKNRLLKATFNHRLLAIGMEVIDINGDGFSYGAYKPNNKEWSKTTQVYYIQNGTVQEYSNETIKTDLI